ncbi:MAG: PstA family ABC transporter permease [Sulfolobales archaeon]
MIRDLISKIMIAILIMLPIIGLVPLFHIIIITFYNGISVMLKNPLEVLISEPPAPGSESLGGIGPYIVGTLILVSLASLIGVPISILAAAYSVESMSRRVGFITTLVTRVMIEFPTIVIGISVYGSVIVLEALLNNLIRVLGVHEFIYIPRFNALSGAIALSIVMIPYVYTQVEDGLKRVPHHIREAVYSLGFSKTRVVIILSGYIRSAILSGLMIGISKIMGETAPLLFTAFGNDYYVTRFPDILLNPIGSLTLWIYKAGLSPYNNWIELAWVASMILILFTIVLFSVSRYIIYKR